MSDAVRETSETHDQPSLRRVIGPRLLLLFIVGDILGTGVYALTGSIAAEVGGAAWAPFLVAFAVATITAFSYLELVTKYPHAAGAALYTHRAFGVHFLTFIVAFAVMSSGITSASTAANAFSGFVIDGFKLDANSGGVLALVLALAFMTVIALINFRGVGGSVKTNVVLTLIEVTGLVLVILIGFWAIGRGQATNFDQVTVFESADGKGAFIAVSTATALAFFAMVGFEDSVNMAEETHEPEKNFPKIMLTGLGITGAIYVLVSIAAVALVPVGQLTESDNALGLVVETGAPDLPFGTIFPFIAMVAVANSALINMLMASRLLYGLARQEVLPSFLGKVHPTRRTPWTAIAFTTAVAFGLITYVVLGLNVTATDLLGGTTALLLLCVFTIVNIALLVCRRRPVDHAHFRAPTVLPYIGALTCAFLAGPWARSKENQQQYEIAAILLGIGVVLWAITWAYNRGARAKKTGFRHPEDIRG